MEAHLDQADFKNRLRPHEKTNIQRLSSNKTEGQKYDIWSQN